jgi:hypothetical protein
MPGERRPRCGICKAPLSGAKVVIDGRWCCGACAYELERGPADRTTTGSQALGQHPQQGRLFPLPAATGKTADGRNSP